MLLLVLCLLAFLMIGCRQEETSLPDSVLQDAEENTPKQPNAEKPEEEPEKEPEEPEASENREPEEEPVLFGDHTSSDGTYRLREQKLEGEDTYVVIRGFPEFLLIEYFTEYEGSVYSFWVEEFWPDDGVFLGGSVVLPGRSQTFSLMTRGNIYEALPVRRTVTMTEEGITLQTEGCDEEVYLRVEDYAYHTAEEALVERLHSMYTIREASELVGCWELWDGGKTIHVTLEEDGGFHFVSKEPGMPVRVMDGAWGVDAETGDLQVVAEQAGDGQYPYVFTWQWRLDDSGYLYLQDEYGDILPGLGSDAGFWRAEDPVWFGLTQFMAMGYVWNSYDLSGEYTDQYGTDYDYSYRLPRFLEEEGDLGKINAEIGMKFSPIIEEELAAMEANEFISTQDVDWNLYVTEEIVTLHVYSFSWEWEEHRTYYYDLRTNSRTDSRELVRRMGIREDEFLEAVRRAAEVRFVETFSDMSESDREANGYADLLAWTISDEVINFDLPIYVDDFGDLCVYARIGSMAGAGEFWAPLYPFADWALGEESVG